MTCVVGVVDKGSVYLGADSIAIEGYDVVTRSNPKLFKLGAFAIGMAGSLRAIDVVRYKFQPPEPTPSQSLHEYMATSFVDALRDTLKVNGVTHIEENTETMGSYLLVGFRGGLFTVENDFQVGVNDLPFASIGAGSAIAMGALYATSGQPAKRRITTALKASETFCAAVRSPFVFLTVRNGAKGR